MALTPTLKSFGKVAFGIGLIVSMVAPYNHAAAPVTHAASYTPLVISDLSNGAWVRNFNPFMPNNANRPTKGGIYETLYITSIRAADKAYPMLATSYAWSKDLKSLTFTIRQGVKWSDGQPFTADDVLFSATFGKTCSAADLVGWWGANGSLASVTESADKSSVTFTYKKVDTTVFVNNFNNFYVVPQHIWASHTSDCGSWANPNPVATGPFANVLAYSPQFYDLGANPTYWQKGEPKIAAIRYVAHTGNDAALLDLKAGKIDWSGNMVPDANNTLDKLGSTFHHQYSAPNTPVQLVLQEKYPYKIPAFRQAVSMAINRSALANIAEYGYTVPSDALGLASQFGSWIDPKLKAEDAALAPAQANVTGAKALLTKAGFKWNSGGALLDPKGKEVDFDIYTVQGWSDWYSACSLMASDLGALGINAGVHQYQFGDWYSHLWGGNFDAAILWQMNSDSPYTLYQNFVTLSDYSKVGTQEAAGSDIGRYKNPATDALLNQYASTTDSATQHAAMDKLEAIWLNDLPTIPLWTATIWENYNTAHFTGFPTASNYYASGQPGDMPDIELVLLNVKPA